MIKNCSICGGREFIQHEIIWPELCEAWELSEAEVGYVNRQQGHCCMGCGANMRSRLLAWALLSSHGMGGSFKDLINEPSFRTRSILEINHAGSLHHPLSAHPNHLLIEYPSFDMMNLDLHSEKYDLLIHSDTLEHVPDPLKAMKECHRVIKQGGKCFFTIPVIVDRLSRSRNGLCASYHGSPHDKPEDYRVHTEFGCDAWKIAFEAGFKTVKLHAMDYPSALAFELEK